MLGNSFKRAARKFGAVCVKVVVATGVFVVRATCCVVAIAVETFREVFSQEPAPAVSPTSPVQTAQHRAAAPAPAAPVTPPPVPVVRANRTAAEAVSSRPVAPISETPVANAETQRVAADSGHKLIKQTATHDSPSSAQDDSSTPPHSISTGTAANVRTEVAPKRANGFRIQLVILYLAIVSTINYLFGAGWLKIAALFARELVWHCRAIQEPLSRAIDALCQRFPPLQKVRPFVSYALGVEAGKELLHEMLQELDRGVSSLFKILGTRFGSLILSS
jgi:hypothetical protein